MVQNSDAFSNNVLICVHVYLDITYRWYIKATRLTYFDIIYGLCIFDDVIVISIIIQLTIIKYTGKQKPIQSHKGIYYLV